MTNNLLPADASLVIYGLGSVGQQVVDELLAAGVAIELIVDRGKNGQEYRGIPILSLDRADDRLAGKTVLVSLHNHYVDVNSLHSDLVEAGAARILSLINLPSIVERPKTRFGYWLDLDFDYAAHQKDFDHVRQLLSDERSREIFDAILRYRQSGELADCPPASLADEYVPADLPRYATPLQMIDCGAFTGVAIHKLIKAEYAIDSFVAFEPDPTSFETLTIRRFPVRRGISLPLGTWSSTTQLRFTSSESSIPAGSHLDADGDIVVQCVAVDDILRGEPVNLVKFDVEGAEVETLKGMERLIRAQRPNLLVSAYHTAGHLYEIAELIESWKLDYRFHLRVHEYNTFGTVLYCLRDELLEGAE